MFQGATILVFSKATAQATLLRITDPRSGSARIKLFAEQELKTMNRKRQFTKNVSQVSIGNFPLQSILHSPDAKIQRHVFIRITQLSQKTFHFFRPSPRAANRLQRFRKLNFSGIDLLQQKAFKGAAVFRAFVVDSATATVECGARLIEFCLAGFVGPQHGQSKRPQSFGIIARLQLPFCEDHAVAAQTAFETKLMGMDRGHFSV
jgi:hypothetical protein